MTVICLILLCALVISLYALWRTYVYIENADAKVEEYRRIAEAAIRELEIKKRPYVEPKMEVIEDE